jgi:hypothetical protein
MVALTVALGVMPQRAVMPGSNFESPFWRSPLRSATSARAAVSVGVISRLRPGAIPWKPVILFSSHRVQSRERLVKREEIRWRTFLG